MSRPPAASPDDARRTFLVCPGSVLCDDDGIRREGGDPVELTHAQATYHKQNGTIEVPLEEFFNDDANSQASDDQSQDGSETDGSGKPAVGDSGTSAASSL